MAIHGYEHWGYKKHRLYPRALLHNLPSHNASKEPDLLAPKLSTSQYLKCKMLFKALLTAFIGTAVAQIIIPEPIIPIPPSLTTLVNVTKTITTTETITTSVPSTTSFGAGSCPTVTSTGSVCSTCFYPECIVLSTIDAPCSCPTPLATVRLDYPCQDDGECIPLGCGTFYSVASRTCYIETLAEATPSLFNSK
ncbi:hypothetical protein BD289DRAFT_236486 [Coniella lustricola]|uniref:Uncharacterized protein n=1 Tax=Coniella lustricola TaxID=2025994 RepID=A0A2T3A9Q3_9PEZI|nr:hypothetical protein BD289DRAFT_236486 [Coniella lustricola]